MRRDAAPAPPPSAAGSPSGAGRSRPASWSAPCCSPRSWSASSAGSCCSRPATACSSTGSTRCVAEAGDETAEAARPARRASPAPTPTPRGQQRELVEPIIAARRSPRASTVVLAGPVDADGAAIADGGAEFTPEPRHSAACPTRLVEHFDDADRRRRGPTPTHPHDRRRRTSPSVPGIVGRLPGRSCPPTARPTRSTTSSRSTRSRRRWRWSPGRCSPPACLLLVLVAGLTWLVTRQVVTPVRLARRVAERLAAGQLAGAAARAAARTTSPAWRTSFNQMATNLQRQIRQLEELSRVQRRFVSDVSHELRTPLTTVRMAGDVLHDARARLRPGDRPGRRAAADRARPLRDAARRPARDQPVRRRRRRARPRRRQPRRRRPPGRRHRPAPLAEQRGTRGASSGRPTTPVPGRGRRTPGRADRAQPGHQRHRPRREPATIVVQVAGDDQAAAIAVRDYGVGPGAGGVGHGLQPLLARRPGPGAHQRRHRPRPVDLARGHPPARRLAPGLGPPGEGAQFRLTLPRRAGAAAAAQPAAAGARRTRRSRSHEASDAARARAGASRCWLLLAAGCVRCPTTGRSSRGRAASDSVADDSGLHYDPRRRSRGESADGDRRRLPRRDDGDPDPDHGGQASSSPRTARRPWEPERETITYADVADAAGEHRPGRRSR